MVIVGDHARPAFHQRIPVPGGMWNPFQPQDGVALNLLGPGTVDVGGQRVAILICYEQLLTWPMLRSAAEKPTILIAMSNESWTAATTVPPDTTRVRSRMGQTLRSSRNFSNQFMRGDPQMQEVLKDNHILTINDVAAILAAQKHTFPTFSPARSQVF
jgi:hypothetical protein